MEVIDEVLELLDNCQPRPKERAVFESCRLNLSDNPQNQKALQELYKISGEHEFLGSGPLFKLKKGRYSSQQIFEKRKKLVEKVRQAIHDNGGITW